VERRGFGSPLGSPRAAEGGKSGVMLSPEAKAQIKAEIERLEELDKICNDGGIQKVIEGWIAQLKEKLISEENSK
jgi:hypothetical protein